MADHPKDLEAGLEGTSKSDTLVGDNSGHHRGPPEQEGSKNDKPPTPEQISENLERFRHYVGIHNSPDLKKSDTRLYSNLGIYQRTVRAERSYGAQYKVYAMIINGVLGLQIVFAASLTALGASNGSHTAVTALGALNTIIAGFLTYLKGSGLPNRLRYYQNEMSKVREYIEQRERDFEKPGHHNLLDMDEEVTIVETMYETVRKDIEMNTPDSYNSAGHSSAKQSGTLPGPSLAHLGERKSRADENKMLSVAEKAAERVIKMLRERQGRELQVVHEKV